MKRTKTFESSYNYFEQGTVVTPSSSRSPLVEGEKYIVESCEEPLFPGDDSVVFVVGRQTGVRGEYLMEVE